MKIRFRGPSCLGIFNTIVGYLFNRVLVMVIDGETQKILGFRIDKASDWPY